MTETHHGWNLSHKPQWIGYIMSVLLIVAGYRIVINGELSSSLLTWTIIGFAFFQALIQLVFFLHLGMETKPHWNMITFGFTVLVIVIVVGGTMWIMANLNYDLMPTMEMKPQSM